MNNSETYSVIGHYCGHFGSGLWGEPLNSLTNIAFLIGALWAWVIWRQQPVRITWVLILIIAAAAIGLGSFIFHSFPDSTTLLGDLIPIQIFALLFLAYALHFRLDLSWRVALGLVAAFFIGRQLWITVVPSGLLGGGVTHLPALLVLSGVAFSLRRRGDRLWRYLLLSIVTYNLALIARTLDPVVCAQFPWGLHWVWHLLTAGTASAIVIGTARHPK